MSWKKDGNKILKNEINSIIKSKELRKNLIISRKQLILLRKDVFKQIDILYNKLSKDINKYISSIDGDMTVKKQKKILAYISKLQIKMRGDLLVLFSDMIYKSIKTGGKTAEDYMVYLVQEAENKTLKVAGIQAIIAKEHERLVNLMVKHKYGNRNVTLSKAIWNITESNTRSIKKILTYHTNSKSSAIELAQDMEGYLLKRTAISKNVRSKIPGLPKDLSYEALRLGRSELTNSFADSIYKTANMLPAYKGITWLLASRHVDPDECTEYANTKKYGSKGFFPKGKEPKPPHPNCLCTQLQEFEDEEDFIKRLKNWEAGGKDKELSEFHDLTKNKRKVDI